MFISTSYPLSAQDPETLDHGDVKLECASSLKIVEFNSSKPFKVVVTEDFSRKHEIKLKALDPTFSANYTWELGSGSNITFKRYWNLYPNEFAALDGVSYINSTLFMPLNNSDFGETNGVIRLKDNSGETALHQAQVFFEKDQLNFWSPLEPNWFYYWKQLFKIRINYPLTFESSIKGYAYSKREEGRIYIGNLASKLNDETKHTGIDCFYETLVHEKHHLDLWRKWWPSGKYDPQFSSEDEYPNQWENDDYEAKELYLFKDKIDDRYGWPKDIDHPSTGGRSPGYMYEEDHCRNKEHEVQDHSLYSSNDWSFDINNLFQGKNWKL